MKPLPHRAEECEPPETRTAQAIRAVREHVAAQAAAKQNPADRAREQLAELHEAIEQSRRRFSSFFSKAERDALTSAQRTRIAKIAETFLGPFARTSTKQQCDEDVTCLVLVARQNRPRRRSGDDIRALKRTASRFDGAAKEAKTLSKKLKDKLAKWEVNVDALAVQLDGCAKIVRGEAASSSAIGTKRVRGSSWTVRQKQLLLLLAGNDLAERRKRHSLTRFGNLANFAVEIWNCAHGTNVDVEAFSYAVDQCQKQRREEAERADERRNEGRNIF